ncbi:nucleotidyltransferase family protein [Novosphingobium mangrovi (ex Huang et al. 2023)]|uniref:Nucleotidyltransferase family protein n=1 Tax=Novosphingobium mangrovi (ex Huang et al. 2023) TaxID=2976432 RepID=A0ABT2HZJ2_9SPHN|nr:nucleotidyltransferase family protein [Novosphingobium mangrovi (ex Huang et al. 2023)]MCT2397965.1 nucleotidyltransferase family protein [Novosphingobium mangrovi (ex Huang et al. 2023)]
MTLAAIVLAAGHATRFGSDKLGAFLEGEPLLFHAIRAARAAPVDRVIVVTRPGLDTGTWTGTPPVDVIRLESTALSESLKAGIAAAAGSDGAFVFLGDMPTVPHEEAARLARLIGSSYAALPRRDGRPGHPVLLSAAAFADIATLTGDEGAGRLLKARDDVAFDECTNPAIHFDVDRPEDLGWLASKGRTEKN